MDIDPQAVEVTKLSLLLKVLEGETGEIINNQLRLFHERALPDLGLNIKCGNSLIGPDFYDNQQMMLLDAEPKLRINVFDWKAEFPEVFRGSGSGSRGSGLGSGASKPDPRNPIPDPGFDAVIGNPPYDVMEKERGASSWPHTALSDYVRVRKEYEAALGGKLNLFRFFLLRSLGLLREGGRFGMIVPLALLADISCARTRRGFFLSTVDLLADCFPQKDNPRRRVFPGAKLSTVVLTCGKSHAPPPGSAQIRIRVYPWNSFADPCRECVVRLQDTALLDPDNAPIPLVDATNWDLCRKVHSRNDVSRLGKVPAFGVTRGEINQTIYREFITADRRMARLLKGVEVGRYRLNQRLSQGEREWLNERDFLRSNAPKPIVDQQRIATQRITGVDERLRIVATFIEPRAYFADSTNSVALTGPSQYCLEYLLGLLNSSLFQWRFKLTSTNNNVGTNELNSMPFRLIDFSSKSDKAAYDRMVSLVERMLSLHKQLAAAKTGHEKEAIQRQIDATDRQIDRLVYDLYGLTEDEIKIVEEATGR